MRYFPTFVDTRARHCLLVGGGPAAAAKLRILAATEARLTVVAADPLPELAAAVRATGHTLRRRAFRESDLVGQALVFVASDDAASDEEIAAASRRRGLPVNVVDRPDLCDFIVPSIVDRDPVVVAISTSGAAPVLARRLRHQLEAWLPQRLGRLARFADRFRQAVKANFDTPGLRRGFWEGFFAGEVAAKVLAGAESEAREAMLSLINGAQAPRLSPGIASIAVTSSDPEDLPLRALRRLWEADLVICDLPAPADERLRDHMRRDADLLDLAAQRPAARSLSARLLKAVRAGQQVVCVTAPDHFIVRQPGLLRAQGLAVEPIHNSARSLGSEAQAGTAAPSLVRAVGR